MVTGLVTLGSDVIPFSG